MPFQSKLTEANYALPYAGLIARSSGFLAENLSLALIEALLTKKSRLRDPSFGKNLKLILKELHELLKNDALNISQNIYPASVLIEEGPLKHTLSLAAVLRDSLRVAERRSMQKHHDLPPDVSENPEYPDYYKRNFHFQTDGYFSDLSARLYDHQVEVLFSGAAGPMRRLCLKALHSHLVQTRGGDTSGLGLRILEIGSGTGSLTRQLKLAFPKIKIASLDMSESYLKTAKNRLKNFQSLEFVQGDAADLPFKDSYFDGVVSCFLFHELPLEVRKKVMQESFRVLRSGGVFSAVDALQDQENQTLNWAIEKFPSDFHEPFFKNYTLHKLESLLREAGFQHSLTEFGFLSKCVTAIK